MADRPIFMILVILIVNFATSLHGKHVIVKRDLIEDDGVDLSSDLLGERRFPVKRDVFSQTYAVSPGKVVDEEADDNSDPDGAEEGSGDVSGSGYQREIVSEAAEDVDENVGNEDQSENSPDEAETTETENARFAANDKVEAIPSSIDKTETKRQFIARPHSRFYSHPGYVYLKAPPIRQKTIVTTRIPRPPIMMSYKQFLRRLAHERYNGRYHAPYHMDDVDDDDYVDRDHEEGEICVVSSLLHYLHL